MLTAKLFPEESLLREPSVFSLSSGEAKSTLAAHYTGISPGAQPRQIQTTNTFCAIGAIAMPLATAKRKAESLLQEPGVFSLSSGEAPSTLGAH